MDWVSKQTRGHCRIRQVAKGKDGTSSLRLPIPGKKPRGGWQWWCWRNPMVAVISKLETKKQYQNWKTYQSHNLCSPKMRDWDTIDIYWDVSMITLKDSQHRARLAAATLAAINIHKEMCSFNEDGRHLTCWFRCILISYNGSLVIWLLACSIPSRKGLLWCKNSKTSK